MSKFVTLHGFGGSGGSGDSELNFEVVGGTTQPANPKENTIWIDTDIDIDRYEFSATEPESPSDDMIWIKVGNNNNSGVVFYIIDGVKMYPVSVQQYIDGVWVNKNVVIYQNGVWIEWGIFLFNYGMQNYTWKASNMPYAISSNCGKATPTVTTNTDGSVSVILGYYGSYRDSGIYMINSAINLTEVSTLHMNWEKVGSPNTVFLTIFPTSSDAWGTDYNYGGDSVAAVSLSSGITESSLDVSNLIGDYYIGIGITTANNYTSGGFKLNTIKML